MLTENARNILARGKRLGWVMEPDAKAIFAEAGFDVPDSILATSRDQALGFAENTGYPVAAKAVSPEIVHKTEHNAVVTGITTPEALAGAFDRLMGLPGVKQVLVETMVYGVEVIIGAKQDFQFGPVVMLGTGGIGVEIFNDTAIGMAPLKRKEVVAMAESLRARELLKGFRGRPGVNMDCLVDTVVRFSSLVMEMAFDSIDLNPVICTRERCVLADARIITANAS